MEIKINDNYKIHADGLCFALSERHIYEKGNNIGQEYWKDFKWYVNLSAALRGYAMHELLKENKVLPHELNDAQEISQRIDELKAEIIAAAEPLVSVRKR